MNDKERILKVGDRNSGDVSSRINEIMEAAQENPPPPEKMPVENVIPRDESGFIH